MHGPKAAVTSVAPSARMVTTAFSTTPAMSPRQPAWTAATTPSALLRPTGAQSAVLTTQRGAGTRGDGGIGLFAPARARAVYDYYSAAVYLMEPRPRGVGQPPLGGARTWPQWPGEVAA